MGCRLIAGTINRYSAEEGWENVHLDKSARKLWDVDRRRFSDPAEIVCDLAELTGHEIYDEVVCSQTLEHLTLGDARKAIHGMRRVLKPGGRLLIDVPDMDAIARAWIEGTEHPDALLMRIYGDPMSMPDSDFNAHRHGYTADSLRELIGQAGFRDISVGQRGTDLVAEAHK